MPLPGKAYCRHLLALQALEFWARGDERQSLTSIPHEAGHCDEFDPFGPHILIK